MKKALVIATVVGFIAGFEKNDISILQEMGYKVHIAADLSIYNNKSSYNALISSGVITHNVKFSRNPFELANIKAFCKLNRLVKYYKFDLIHCHTPVGGVLGRLAGHLNHVDQVIYSAHGFHFFKGSPIHNWLIYYPIEKFLSRWTDVLITINMEDYECAKKKFHMARLKYVPGVGIDLDKYSVQQLGREERLKLRTKLGIPKDATWLLSVGELNENKNHEIVIRALSEMLNNKTNTTTNIYYTIAGCGSKIEILKSLVEEFGLSGRVCFLGYRSDVSLLCESADIFVMPSFREGLSVSLMEAMASGMPCLASRIRGNTDLVDDKGGLLFDPYSIDECKKALETLIDSDFSKLGAYNRNKIKHFSRTVVEKTIREIYKKQ